MILEFKSNNEATSLKSSVRATTFLGIYVPFPGGSYDVCADIANNVVHCPVPANTKVTYEVEFTVPSWVPSGMRSTVEFQITDQKSQVVTCVRIPVIVA